MSRERFQSWGDSLSGMEFRCALAAAGVLSTLAAPAAAGLEDRIAERLGDGDEPVLWRFPWNELDRRRNRVPDEQVRAMAAAWKSAIRRGRGTGEGSGHLRLLLHLDGAGPAAGWVARELAEPDVGARAVAVDQGRRGRVRWTWPLQVGSLDDPPSLRLLEQLRKTAHIDTPVPLGVLNARGERCDLLVLPHSLREATALVLAQGLPVQASCVAVLGGTLEPWERTVELQATLRGQTGAAGVFVAAVPEHDRARWFERVVEELSHNNPLDVALSLATLPDAQPLLFATQALLVEARLGNAALRLARRMAEAAPEVMVAVGDDDASMLDLSPARSDSGVYHAHVVGGLLRTRLNNFTFRSERGDASVVARMEASFGKGSVAAVAVPRGPRYLQSRVWVMTRGTAPRPRRQKRAFRPGATHHVEVRVGPKDPEWEAGADAYSFPEYKLPPSTAGHELRVVFTEPRHLDAPQIATITLPAGGPSTVCRFTFVPREGVPEVEARVAVLYENRVLQTALLRGPVREGESRRSPGRARRPPPITFEVEAVVHPDESALDERSHFHAALVLNRNNDGARRAVATTGDRVGMLELEGLENTLTFIRGKLSETPPSRTGPTGTPFSPETVKLLRTLGYHGRMLHNALVDQLGGVLGPATRIQILAAKPDAYLPLELVYDHTIPDFRNAEMCPNAAEAARTGACPDCPTLTDAIPSRYVCPAGFWGLNRVIERHAYDPATPRPDTSFELFNVPSPARQGTLHPLRCALYAASNNVEGENAKKKTRIKGVLNALKRATGAAAMVDDWNEWTAAVEKQRPSLLVVLSHTVYDPEYNTLELEIASEHRLPSGNINELHVRGPAPAGEPPVVLLLGCETIAPEVGYQGFVPAFRQAGAAVVLCTNSTVLGREVAPAAETLVGILKDIMAGGAEVSFADAVLRLRRDAVANGMPMGLGLVAYGDADWRLSN